MKRTVIFTTLAAAVAAVVAFIWRRDSRETESSNEE